MAELGKQNELRGALDRLELVPLSEADLERIDEIESHSFSTPWPKESFGQLLDDPVVWASGARLSGQLVGYLIGLIQLRPRSFLIANLAVHPHYRKRGVARLLIQGALNRAERLALKSVVLDVRQSNIAALKLYIDFGFRIVGKRIDYYSDPVEDALVMKRLLKGRPRSAG